MRVVMSMSIRSSFTHLLCILLTVPCLPLSFLSFPFFVNCSSVVGAVVLLSLSAVDTLLDLRSLPLLLFLSITSLLYSRRARDSRAVCTVLCCAAIAVIDLAFHSISRLAYCHLEHPHRPFDFTHLHTVHCLS